MVYVICECGCAAFDDFFLGVISDIKSAISKPFIIIVLFEHEINPCTPVAAVPCVMRWIYFLRTPVGENNSSGSDFISFDFRLAVSKLDASSSVC